MGAREARARASERQSARGEQADKQGRRVARKCHQWANQKEKEMRSVVRHVSTKQAGKQTIIAKIKDNRAEKTANARMHACVHAYTSSVPHNQKLSNTHIYHTRQYTHTLHTHAYQHTLHTHAYRAVRTSCVRACTAEMSQGINSSRMSRSVGL